MLAFFLLCKTISYDLISSNDNFKFYLDLVTNYVYKLKFIDTYRKYQINKLDFKGFFYGIYKLIVFL